MLNKIIPQYKKLLETIDAWFDRAVERAGEEIVCRKSCTGCCRGLFEISLLDAALLQQGFARLDHETRHQCLKKSQDRLAELQRRWPQFTPPYILNHLPHDEWQQMPEDDETPCPLLAEDGRCLVYSCRPMTCRLHGVPNIDLSGEIFSEDFCTLNFPDSDPLGRDELRWDFRKTFEQEFKLLGAFSEQLTGQRQLELDTFIPTALLIDFNETDWPQLLSAGKPRSS